MPSKRWACSFAWGELSGVVGTASYMAAPRGCCSEGWVGWDGIEGWFEGFIGAPSAQRQQRLVGGQGEEVLEGGRGGQALEEAARLLQALRAVALGGALL